MRSILRQLGVVLLGSLFAARVSPRNPTRHKPEHSAGSQSLPPPAGLFNLPDLYQLVQDIPEGIAFVDAQDKTTFVNEPLAGMLGYRAEEMIGASLFSFMDDEMQPVASEWLEYLRAGTGERHEFKFRRRDGTELWTLVAGTPLFDAERNYAGLRAIVTDLTERRRVESTLQRYNPLARLNECFLSFGGDSRENINRLVAFLGMQLGATAALYNRLEEGELYAVGQWHTPADFAVVTFAEGHICYDVIRQGGETPHVIRDLAHSAYAQTDPNILRYRLKSFAGQAVLIEGQCVGSLCLVYQEDRIHSAEELELLGIVAAAIGVEEQRRTSSRALRESEERYRQLVFRDITARKRAEQAQRESERQFRLLADTLPYAIAIYRQDRFCYVNSASELLTGYTEAEFLNMSISDLIHPDFVPLVITRAQARQRGEAAPQRYECKILTKSREERWVDLTVGSVEFEGEPAALGACFDITERKRVEQMQDALYRLSQAADQAQTLDDLFVTIHAIISDVMPANNFYIALYDEKEDLLSFPYFVDEVDVADMPRKPGKGLTEYTLRTGKSLLCTLEIDAELRQRGEIELVGEPSAIWLGVPLMVEKKTIGVMAVQHYSDPHAYGGQELHMLEFVSSRVAQSIDRTFQMLARAQAEQALRESEERYRQLFENAPTGIYRTTPDGEILMANPALTHMLGYDTFAELRDANLDQAFHQIPEARARFKEILEREGKVVGWQDSWVRRDGTVILVQENARAVRSEDGALWYYEGTAEDITERKRTEETLARRAREMTALYETTRDLAAPRELPALLQTVVDRAVALLHTASGAMYLLDPSQQYLELVAAHGSELAQGTRFELREGITRTLFETHQPVIIDHYHNSDQRSPRYEQVPLAAVLEVPMLYGGELIGALAVSEMEPNPRRFTEEEARLLSMFAGQVASAVRNARLLEETRTRAGQLALLYDAGLALNSVLEPHAQLEFLFKIAMRTLRADRAEFFRLDPARKHIVLELGVGYSEDRLELLRHLSFPVSEENSLLGWVYQNRVPLNVPDLRADSRAVTIDPEVYSGIWVPVEHQNQLRGILGMLNSQVNAFSAQDERLLTLFANQAAVALENARLFAETQQRTQRQAALYSISTSLGSVQSIPELCELVVRAGNERLGYSHLGIFLLDPVTGDRVLQAHSGSGTEHATERLHAGEGLSERALLTGELQYWWDVSREPRHVPGLRGARSEIDVPIQTGESVLGVMIVEDARVDAFDSGDFEILQAVANQLAVALERAKLYADVRQELADRKRVEATLRDKVAALQTLATIDREIIAANDSRMVLDLVCRSAAELLHAPKAIVVTVLPNSMQVLASYGLLEPEAAHAEFSQQLQQGTFPLSQPSLREPDALTHIAADPPQMPEFRRRERIEAIARCSLRAADRLLGMLLVFDTEPRTWHEDELELLSSLAGEAALLVDKSRLWTELQTSLAMTTQLYELSGRILAATTFGETARLIVDTLQAGFKADAATICLYDAQGQISFNYGVGLSEAFFARPALDPAGLAMRTWKTGRRIIARTPEELRPATRAEGIQSAICLPLPGDTLNLGIFFLGYRSAHAFSEREVELISLFANQTALAIKRLRLLEEAHQRAEQLAAAAIDRTRLFETTRQRAEQLAVLNRIASAVSRTLNLDGLVEIIYSEVSATISADAFFLALYEEATGELDYRIRIDQGEREPLWRKSLGEVPLTAYTITTRRPVLIRDWEEEKHNYPVPSLWGSGKSALSWLGVPMQVGTEVVGIICVQAYRPKAYGEDEKQWLTTIADQAAVAIQNARLFEETQQRLAELETVNRILTLVRGASSEEMFPLLLDQTLAVLGTGMGQIVLYDAETARLHTVIARGWFNLLVEGTDGDDGLVSHVFKTGEIHVARELKRDPQLNDRVRDKIPAGWGGVLVPIRAAQEPIGVLEISIPPQREIQANDVHLITTVAEIVGNAVHRMRLNESLEASYLETVLALANAIEVRGRSSQGHNERLAAIAMAMASEMGLAPEEQENLRLAALLHDIGKLGVPDGVLLKPGPLDQAEWLLIQRHPVLGSEIIQPVKRLREVVPLVRYHQERFDGAGYPEGICGQAIPLGARILAVADAFTVMLEDRPYRPKRSWDEALSELRRCAGIQFDPQAVEVLIKLEGALKDKFDE